jgi:sec-independent protein translocase protein TatA
MITGHWYVILALMLIVLIFYGPGKLPEIGGAVGKAMHEFRKARESVAKEIGQPPTPSSPGESTSMAEATSEPAPTAPLGGVGTPSADPNKA